MPRRGGVPILQAGFDGAPGWSEVANEYDYGFGGRLSVGRRVS
jgi:hypothetical protein